MERRQQSWIISIVLVLVLTLVAPVTTYAVSASELHNPKRNEETHETGGTHETDFSYVYFGMYPQKEITGSEITDAIRNASYDKYGDAVVNGKKYRRLTYEMMSTYGTIAQFGKDYIWTPYSDNGYRYFLYEPIKWKVLNCDNGTAFLFADLMLDTQAYHYQNSSCDWEDCSIRKWLNSDTCIATGGDSDAFYKTKGFYGTAFDSDEKSRIVITTTQSCDNPVYTNDQFDSVSTEDRIFLLNFDEITSEEYGYCMNYALGYTSSKDKYHCGMAIPASEYAIALEGEEVNTYWLRTKGKYTFYALYVGAFYTNNVDRSNISANGINVSVPYMGVAPAINISYSLSDCIKVNFVTNGAGTVDSEILLGSGYAKEPDVLQKDNYYFTGWYTDAECTQKYNFNSKVTKDLTLYAGWKPYVTVTFNTNGGSVIKAQSIVQGTKLSKPAEPVKEDYVFTGWYTDAACTKSYDFNQAVNTNVTLYAGWKVRDLKLNEKITSGGATYQVVDSSSKSVQYYSLSKKSATTVTVPATVSFNGVEYKVTSVRKNAFKNCKKLKKVTVGKNVTTIGSNAFYGCKKLTTVTFKGVSVKTIGASAFRNCTSLKKITIPKGVTTIGQNAFRNCKKLNKITIKSTTLKKIGSKAFTNINKKAKFIVPKKKLKAYKKLLKKKTGYKSSMQIKR